MGNHQQENSSSNYAKMWPESVLTIFDYLLPLKRSNPFSGYPIHKDEKFQPFFIIGAPRSGNTLLRRLLYAHPDIHIPPETYVLGKTIRLYRQYNKMNWPDLVHFTLAQFEFYQEFETFGVSLRPLVQRLIVVPENKRSLACILNAIYQYHAEMTGKICQRWGDKTPLNTFFLERIFSVFPDGQFINIIRDGVDVVASCLQSGLFPSIESATNRWLGAIKKAEEFNQKHPTQFTTIRYEFLVQNPPEAVQHVCSFLNIKCGSDILDTMINSQHLAQKMGDVKMRSHHTAVQDRISLDSIGKGRRQLSSSQKQFLQQEISHKLIKLGYDPIS